MHFIVVIRRIRFVCANPDVFGDLRIRFLWIRETSRKVPVPFATFDNLYIDAAVLFQTRKLTINILRRHSALALTRFDRDEFKPGLRLKSDASRGVGSFVSDLQFISNRSEERRVGKECRSRWSLD